MGLTWYDIKEVTPPKNTMLFLFDKLWQRPYVGVQQNNGYFYSDAHGIINPIYWSFLDYPEGHERNDTCGGLLMRF